MKNLEFYKDDILRETEKNDNLICSICEIKNKKCLNENDDECPFEKDLFAWLYEEYNEPIKLKQWEYDLTKLYSEEAVFYKTFALSKMYDKGHFKGVYDTSLTVKEILDNYIIVADDYEF